VVLLGLAANLIAAGRAGAARPHASRDELHEAGRHDAHAVEAALHSGGAQTGHSGRGRPPAGAAR
jgi:hypothetical protein